MPLTVADVHSAKRVAEAKLRALEATSRARDLEVADLKAQLDRSQREQKCALAVWKRGS
jgi:hypothetical protein